MNDENTPVPLWQKLAAAGAAILIVAGIVVWRDRLAADFWPPDASRVGPNLIASLIQALIVLVVAVLVWPPFRRRLHAFVDRKVAPLHDRLGQLHEQREAHQAEQMAKLEAIHDHLKATHPLR